jgi:hypothetical protein
METEAPARRNRPSLWLIAVLLLAIVGLVANAMWPEKSAATPPQPSNRSGRTTKTASTNGIDPADLRVRLEALQAKPQGSGEMERNPFRFKPPPAPPPPPPVTLRKPEPGSVGPPPPPPPPPVPPIPLKFMGTIERGNLKLAALTDCKGFTYAAREGDSSIDGRYRLVKIQVESVIMEYNNGTGRITIRQSGECPK